MPSKTVHRHVDSTELGHDVRASRELRDVLLPFAEYLSTMSFIGTDSKRTAEVIENNRRVGERARECGHHRNLRMVLPGLEAEAQLAQLGKAFAETLRLVQILGRVGVRIPDLRTRVEAPGMTDAAKTRRSRRYVRLQYFLDRGAQRQIREAHDSRRDASLAVLSARALRRDAVDEFGLAH